MKNAWKLFSYGDTPIYLKYWFLALLIFIPIPWVCIFFVSILVHEISHARTAKKLGYKTDYIFIDIFHGGALIDGSYVDNNKHTLSIAFAYFASTDSPNSNSRQSDKYSSVFP